jgi:16S rRNA processing protein RimM
LKKTDAAASQQFITIGRILRPQGRRGELAVEPLTDFPEKFAERRVLSAVSPSGERRELRLEDVWEHKGVLVMKFCGIDSISDAEQLAGYDLQIPAAERGQLEAGSAYAVDLIGCTVLTAEKEIGVIDDVQFGAGEAPLLIVKSFDKRELMIPFAQAYILQFDLTGKRLVMDLPQGMLELDAPLTPEEKKQQQE